MIYSEQKLESEWVGVIRRKGERKKPKSRGTGTSRGRKFKAAKQTTWMYVGRLRQGTTPRKVVEHMVDKGVIDCEQLETKGRSKAFKVGFDLEELFTRG